MTLQIAGFLDHSTVNGEGFRSVIFLSGCPHHCLGCHNEAMQDYTYGESIEISDLLIRIQKVLPLIDGVTLSGGEPFEQSKSLIPLVTQLKTLGLTIWCYTGYTYEALQKHTEHIELLKFIDVLIDGSFIEALKDEHLTYKGSSNQRILKLSQGKVIAELNF